jgi:hypothetical protein
LAEPPAAPAWESLGSASAHLPAAAAPDGAHSVSPEVQDVERSRALAAQGGACSRVPAVPDEVHSASPEVRDEERFLALAAQDGACLPDAIHSRDEHFHAAYSTRAQLAPVSSHGSQPGESKSRVHLRLPVGSRSQAGLRLTVGSRSQAGLRLQGDSRSRVDSMSQGDSPFLCYSALLLDFLPVEPSLLDFPPEP